MKINDLILERKIENLRQLLYRLISNSDLTDKKVVEYSQKLDILITESKEYKYIEGTK